MDVIFQSLSAMPWYGWVAIVAILGGVVVKLAGKSKERA